MIRFSSGLPCVFQLGLLFFVGLSTCLSVWFPAQASTLAEIHREVPKEILAHIDEETRFRRELEKTAGEWAKDLMGTQRAELHRPHPLKPKFLLTENERKSERQRLLSEIAWLLLIREGSIAVFDFSHAEWSAAGVRSRLAVALEQSPIFWNEVRNQCRALFAETQITDGSLATAFRAEFLKSCQTGLRHRLRRSQVAGSSGPRGSGSRRLVGWGEGLCSFFSKMGARTFGAPHSRGDELTTCYLRS